MLRKRTIIRIKNIIISTLLASFLLNTVSYAEINGSQMNSVINKISVIDETIINTGNLDIEEVDLSYTLNNDNWIAFYKNFIRELGGIRISYYNENGNLIAKKNVLPKQFEGSSYEFERETLYAENTFILRDTVNKYYIDLSNSNFSDNIPCFIKNLNEEHGSTFDSDTDGKNKNKNYFIDVDFNKWENCKTISEWLEDRSNLQNLTDELGVDFEGSDNLEVWLSKNEENCKSAGILIEPITFYPDSTEEIYCNDKTISKNYNLTHGITSSRLETEMKERGEWNWILII